MVIAYEPGDSSAWLAYFANESSAEFFAKAIEDEDLWVVPSARVYEVFKVVLRKCREDDALSVAAAMQRGVVVDLKVGLAMEAASVGIEEKLAFADSVIYAIARKHHATLWTQDAHFAGKPGVRYRPKGTGA